MRLSPLQIIGLLAVVGFGIKLVVLLTEPKRDPFSLPGAMPISAPIETSVPEPPAPVAEAPPPTSDLLGLGPDEAKDDLYCSGLIFAAHRESSDVLSDEAQKRRAGVLALASAGVEKLIAAKAADATQTAAIADAHAAKAAEDFAAGTPRLTVEACEQRASAQEPAPQP